jgi:hypothetical protein
MLSTPKTQEREETKGILSAMGATSREQVDAMILQTLNGHPKILGFCSF